MSSRQWQWCRGLSEICKLMTLHANKDDRIQNKKIGDIWEKERSNGVMSLSKCAAKRWDPVHKQKSAIG